MAHENEGAPQRISLFSAAAGAAEASGDTAKKPGSLSHDTAVLSPYDPPVHSDTAQSSTQVFGAISQTFAPVSAEPATKPVQPTSYTPISDASLSSNSQEYDKQAKKARKAEEKALRRQNGEGGKKKKVLIGVGIVAAVLAIGYFSGVYVYSHRFFPHTTFGALDVSNTSFEDATKIIDDNEKDYSLAVTGQGLDFAITPDESGMDISAEQIVDAARTTMNPWTWPAQWFKEHDLANSAEVTLDDSALGSYVIDQVNAFNETRPASENARIEYDSASASWAIVPEVYGEQFDSEKVTATVTSCIFQRADTCTLSDDELLKPAVRADDKSIVAGAKAANDMMGVNAEFRSPVAQGALGKIDSAQLSQWITFDENFNPSINQEALSAWATEMVKPLSTVGVTRNYTRPDGKQVTVSGGTFGCSVSKDNVVAAVNKAIEEKATGNISLERKCAGTQAPEGSATEWGAYVDVDLTEQHARYYDASGNLVWESGIVSGNVAAGNSTPTGVWYLNSKGRHVTLRGPRDANGVPEWESPVSYWMPFIGGSHGLHDASWRSAAQFNNPAVHRTNGSHGCVNLPPSSAGALYSAVQVGTPVIVHK